MRRSRWKLKSRFRISHKKAQKAQKDSLLLCLLCLFVAKNLVCEFAQGRVPLSLGSQDELYNFTDGALTACGARYVCGTGGHFRSGVGNSDGESDAGKDWKVLHVVSDIAHPVLR